MKKKIICIFLCVSLFCSLLVSVCGAENFLTEKPKVEVVIDDISNTQEAAPILTGEAKVKISISGLKSDANIVQIALDFSGNMEYKAVQWLIEKDSDVLSSLQVVPDGDILYLSAVFNERVIKGNGENPTDICILTFRGDPGDSVFLSLIDDVKESYIEENYPKTENPLSLNSDDEIAATAVENGAKAQNAKVSLVMNKVADFNLNSENRNISISIIGEDEDFPIMFSTPVEGNSKAIIPTLVVDTVLAAEQTYTVRIEGAGYIPYEKKGVSFEKELKIENDEFIPGELVEDGVIDINDKKAFEEILAEGIYDKTTERADFNRDGKIDSKDAKVYADIKDEVEAGVPEKPEKPTVTGGDGKITVEWEVPEDGGSKITGYVIKYGTSITNLDKTKEITNLETTSTTIFGLLEDKTYYVQVAAQNAVGLGEFSDITSAKTNYNVNGGGGGGGIINIPVTGIEIDKKAVMLNKTKAIALSATIYPSNATNKDIIWVSSDEGIATVDKAGIVTGIKEGTATIIAISLDGYFTARCTVNVYNCSTFTTYKTLVSTYKFYIECDTPLTEEFLVVACYDEEGRMISVRQVQCDGDTEYTASVPIDERINYAKVFVWNSYDDLNPTGAHETITFKEDEAKDESVDIPANYAYVTVVAIDEDLLVKKKTAIIQMVTADGVIATTLKSTGIILDGESFDATEDEITFEALEGKLISFSMNIANKITEINTFDANESIIGGMFDVPESAVYNAENNCFVDKFILDTNSHVFFIADERVKSFLGTEADLVNGEEYEILGKYADNKADANNIVVVTCKND